MTPAKLCLVHMCDALQQNREQVIQAYIEIWTIRPFHKRRAPVRLCLPVTQKTTKSLKTLLVSHAKTFEMTKQT